ncbi:MAG: hypothetical protein AAGE84_08270 [Cyanobacteria bacterium P01_G01_bin.39]
MATLCTAEHTKLNDAKRYLLELAKWQRLETSLIPTSRLSLRELMSNLPIGER